MWPALLFASTALAADAAHPFLHVGYIPTWVPSPLDGIDLRAYTHANIAFALPLAGGSLSIPDEAKVGDIVASLKSQGTRPLIAVGGYTGSAHFSGIVADPATAGVLVADIVAFIDRYDLQGVDIDWEFPGQPGDKCTGFDGANDIPNLIKFLGQLREAMDQSSNSSNSSKLITMAVPASPFCSLTKEHVSEMHPLVDFINLMQYDINGPWNTVTGPHAPLHYEEGKATQVSFSSSIAAWKGMGWPVRKMVAGLAFYGRVTRALADMTLDPENQYQPQSTERVQGDADDQPIFDPCLGATSVSGTWKWKNLRREILSDGPTTASAPWVRYWDNTTQTPWLFNKETMTYMSYEDPQSIESKAGYARSLGLRGLMVWSSEMDFDNELTKGAKSIVQ